jgi:hypothetical protein
VVGSPPDPKKNGGFLGRVALLPQNPHNKQKKHEYKKCLETRKTGSKKTRIFCEFCAGAPFCVVFSPLQHPPNGGTTGANFLKKKLGMEKIRIL